MIHKIITFLKSESFLIFFLLIIAFGYGAALVEISLRNSWWEAYVVFGLMVGYCFILGILKHFDPYYRVLNAIGKQESEKDKVQTYYDKLLPIKQDKLPKQIFKYVALFDSDVENNKRFRTLENDEVWFSSADCLNDSFEGYNAYYSKDFPLDVGVGESNIERRIENWKKYIEYTRKNFLICSFSTDNRIAPMWAHYTGNGRGFCIEYELINPINFFQVQYWSSKYDVCFDMERLQKEYFWGELSSEEFIQTITNLQRIWCSMKGRDWEYEREIRAIIYDETNTEKGLNKKAVKVGIKIKGIYIGFNCSEDDEKRLVEIANKLKIFVKKMEPDYAGEWSIMKESN